MVKPPALRRTPPISRGAWALMLVPLSSILFPVAVLTWMSRPLLSSERFAMADPFESPVFEMSLLGFTFLPAFSLVVLIAFTSQRWPLGMPLVAAGGLVQLVATVALYGDTLTSRSSTAALGIFFFPAALVILLVPSLLSADWLHRRRQSNLSQV